MESSRGEIGRQDIQSAISKAVELRALHTPLRHARLPSASPFSPVLPHFSARDYPVFNPTYEEDRPLPGYHQILRKYGESWGDYASGDVGSGDEMTSLSDYRMLNAALSSTKEWLPSRLMNMEDHDSATESRGDDVLLPVGSPDCSKPRRSSLGDVKSVSSSNKCRPTLTSNDSDRAVRSSKKSNSIIRPSLNSQQMRNKGLQLPLSWLFPKMKRKSKTDEASPVHSQLENSSQLLNDVKKELIEAQRSRDAALIEVTRMRSSLGELSQKLEYLEGYCEELKTALRQAMQTKISRSPSHIKPTNAENRLEDFMQVVSESRLSVKRFCKTLLSHVVEGGEDDTLSNSLNALLQPYRLSLTSRHSKTILYHVEAIVNRLLHEDFENCMFRESGAPRHLDPEQERQAKVEAFMALRGLSSEKMVRKCTKWYNDDFVKFYDRKMGVILAALGWRRPWAGALLEAFFGAAKYVWLVHLVAFSLDPPIGILRVEDNRVFEARYMDDVFADKTETRAPSRVRVKVMVMPGFYDHQNVLSCKVLCRYKSLV